MRKKFVIGTAVSVCIIASLIGGLTNIKQETKTVAASEIEDHDETLLKVKKHVVGNPRETRTFEVVERETIQGEERELLARCVMAEAGNQGILGQRYVVAVILNRVESPDYPNTITEVITQRGQFSSYWDGGMDRHTPTEDTYTAIDQEYLERSDREIMFFRTQRYSDYGTPAFKYKDHYFSK